MWQKEILEQDSELFGVKAKWYAWHRPNNIMYLHPYWGCFLTGRTGKSTIDLSNVKVYIITGQFLCFRSQIPALHPGRADFFSVEKSPCQRLTETYQRQLKGVRTIQVYLKIFLKTSKLFNTFFV